ncbi:MAG: class I SAM-dependent rRNA methyltransferase [Bryobacteraceae bacterium]
MQSLNPAEVRVSRKGADRVTLGHPWIFRSDVADSGAAAPGDVVKVLDWRGRPLGMAHYSAASQIALRMLTRRVEEVGREFFRERLRTAIAFRERVVRESEAYRLVHAEGDLLAGLVVDRYGEYLAIQTLDQGMDRAKGLLVDLLQELVRPRGIAVRNDVASRTREALPLEKGVLWGEVPERVSYRMNGFRFETDLLGGQKTGVFLDQRENYLAAARYAHGRALDCFTSTGGFALHLAARCESVEAVDSSMDALQTADANREANGIANVEFTEANVFDLLAGYDAAGRRFSTIVLDPPAFAKSRTSLDAAARGYKEINLRALRMLDSGGVLVTCSCSYHVSEAMLLELVAAASLDARRTLRVIERRTQSQDHPILLTTPETHYLKCVIFEVV